ncbi:MAG: hypothetical protein ACI9VT_003023 [Psychroserpens sp.]|jgi:hypothetical protein
MLDTNICSFIMHERPIHLLKVLQAHVENKDRIVVSAITFYLTLRHGQGYTYQCIIFSITVSISGWWDIRPSPPIINPWRGCVFFRASTKRFAALLSQSYFLLPSLFWIASGITDSTCFSSGCMMAPCNTLWLYVISLIKYFRATFSDK